MSANLVGTRRTFLLLCAVTVAIALAGQHATAQPKLKVGVFHLGSINDAGYNQAHAEGVQIMKRNAYSVGYHYIGVQKFAPKGWISGIAFTWGNLYTRFAKQVMDGTWKSEDILGGLGDDYLTIAPFGPAVSPAALKIVNARKQEFITGKARVFLGPIRDNKGVERVKAGEFFPLSDLRKMDWLVGGMIGQPR